MTEQPCSKLGEVQLTAVAVPTASPVTDGGGYVHVGLPLAVRLVHYLHFARQLIASVRREWNAFVKPQPYTETRCTCALTLAVCGSLLGCQTEATEQFQVSGGTRRTHVRMQK